MFGSLRLWATLNLVLVTGAFAQAQSAYFRSLGPVPIEGIPDLLQGTTPARAARTSKLSGDGSKAVVLYATSPGTRQFVVMDTASGAYTPIDVLDKNPSNSFLVSSTNHISADGNVIIGSDPDQRVFRWSEATGVQYLLGPNGNVMYGVPTGVNADGSKIVGQGSEQFPALGDRRGFAWTTSTNAAMPLTFPIEVNGVLLPAVTAFPTGLSDDGTMLVVSQVLPDRFGSFPVHPFQPVAAGIVNVPVLDMLGSSRPTPSIVSSDGSIIVAPGVQSVLSYRYRSGVTETIPGITAWGLSGDGETMIGYGPANSGPLFPTNSPEPLVWAEQTGVVPFDELLQSAGLGNNIDANTRVSFLMDVSDDGKTFLGLRTRWTARLDPTTYQLDYFVARVPEASSTLLVGIALFVLGAGRFLLPRRRIF